MQLSSETKDAVLFIVIGLGLLTSGCVLLLVRSMIRRHERQSYVTTSILKTTEEIHVRLNGLIKCELENAKTVLSMAKILESQSSGPAPGNPVVEPPKQRAKRGRPTKV